MSLDKNLFTLNVKPIPGTLDVELVDPDNTTHYRKERTEGPGGFYQFNVFDPLSGSMLASVTGPNASSKTKTIELHNPSVPVELKFTGIFTFKWTFKWEDHEFEWKREECVLIRKPDPPVLVAVTKEPPGKLKTKTVQILDYNLKRFEIFDRKGLEVVLLSSLLSFQDFSEEKAKEPTTLPDEPNQTPTVNSTPPPLPPKPEKTGAELVASMQTGELGEIVVSDEGTVNDYAQYCANLLEGGNMLYTVLKSSSASTVPKVLEIVHQTKRIRHKEGIDEELHQYVQYDTEKKSRVIKLDDKTSEYKPPESLLVHLSKIVMPELQPKAKETERQRRLREEAEREARELAASANKKGKGKETRNEKKKREKEEAEQAKRFKEEEMELARLEKEHKKAKKSGSKPSPPRPSEAKLSKPHPDPRFPSKPVSSHFVTPVSSAPPGNLAAPRFQNGSRTPSPYLRSASSPRIPAGPAQPYPPQPQRPVSAFGAFLRPPPPPPQEQRRLSPSPNTLMDSLVYKFRTRGR